MNIRITIKLLIVVIVIGLTADTAWDLGYGLYEDIRFKQGEEILNLEGVEIIYSGLLREKDSDQDAPDKCHLLVDVRNRLVAE